MRPVRIIHNHYNHLLLRMGVNNDTHSFTDGIRIKSNEVTLTTAKGPYEIFTISCADTKRDGYPQYVIKTFHTRKVNTRKANLIKYLPSQGMFVSSGISRKHR